MITTTEIQKLLVLSLLYSGVGVAEADPLGLGDAVLGGLVIGESVGVTGASVGEIGASVGVTGASVGVTGATVGAVVGPLVGAGVTLPVGESDGEMVGYWVAGVVEMFSTSPIKLGGLA